MLIDRPVLLAGLLLSASPLMAATPGQSFSHFDWELACDNTRTCRAAGYSKADSERPASILLTRRAGADAAVDAQLQLVQIDDSQGPVGELVMRQGGHELARLPSRREDVHPLDAAQRDALLVALLGLGPIHIDDQAGQQWQVSDRGATAVLLKMDELQGRVDTPTALVRKGNKPAHSVLPAVALPVLERGKLQATTAQDRALEYSPQLQEAVLEELNRLYDECWQPLDPRDGGLSIERLDAGTLLIGADCWQAAYNSANAYWTMPDQPPYRLSLVTTRANAYHDGELSAVHRGRGIGDCLSQQAWVWDGRRFVLSLDSSTGDCRGQLGGFWELPTWQMQVR